LTRIVGDGRICLEKESRDEKEILVRPGNEGKQRPRSGTRCLHPAYSPLDRTLAEALRGREPETQKRPFSLGDVNAEFLYQSRRQESPCAAQKGFGAGQNGVAAAVPPGVILASVAIAE